MQTAVRHMISQFMELEEPYLTKEARSKRDRRRKGGFTDDDDVWNGEEVNVNFETGEGTGAGDFFDMVYKIPGFLDRIRWTRSKKTALSLYSRIQQIQLRRVAMQATEIGLSVTAIIAMQILTIAGL
jgi:hypothetical protein